MRRALRRALPVTVAVGLLLAVILAAGAAWAAAPVPPGEVWDMPESGGRTVRLSDVPPAPAEPEMYGDTIAVAADACYPEPDGTWFRPEVGLTVSPDTRDGAGSNAYWAGITATLPLYSHSELERTRERALQRRAGVAAAVGRYLTARAAVTRGAREMALFDAVETRARARVKTGVAESAEQQTAAVSAIRARGQIDAARADLVAARLELLAPCDVAGRERLEAALHGGGAP